MLHKFQQIYFCLVILKRKTKTIIIDDYQYINIRPDSDKMR